MCPQRRPSCDLVTRGRVAEWEGKLRGLRKGCAEGTLTAHATLFSLSKRLRKKS